MNTWLLVLWLNPVAQPAASSVTLVVDNNVPAGARASIQTAVLDAVERSTSCRFVEPPPLSTDELVVAVGCKGLNDQCAKALGGTLKVDHVLLATVNNGTLRVSIHPPRKKGLGTVSVPLDPADKLAPTLRARLQPALGPAKPARLLVQSEPAGLSVTSGGKNLGQTPLTVESLPEGHHVLEVGGTGWLSQTLEVDLQAGQQSHLQVTAQPAPSATAPLAGGTPPATTPTTSTTTTTATASPAGTTTTGAPPAGTAPPQATPTTPPPAEGGGAWRYGAAAAGAVAMLLGALTLGVGALVLAAYGGVYGALFAHGSKLVQLPVRQRDYVTFDNNRLYLLAASGGITAVAVLVGLVLAGAGGLLVALPWFVGGD